MYEIGQAGKYKETGSRTVEARVSLVLLNSLISMANRIRGTLIELPLSREGSKLYRSCQRDCQQKNEHSSGRRNFRDVGNKSVAVK